MRHCATPADKGASRVGTGAGMSSGGARVSRLRCEIAKGARWSAGLSIAVAVLVVALSLLGERTVGWAAVAEYEGPPQPAPQWRVIATVNYSSGSYGTDFQTNILYAPMTVRKIFRDGDVSLTIPFVSISGTGAVRLVGGMPTRTSSVSGSTVGVQSVDPGAARSPERALYPPPQPTAASAI